MNFGLNGLGGGLSFMRILGSISKTLGIVRQVAPLYQNVKPLLSKAPQFLARINSLRGMAQTSRSNLALPVKNVTNSNLKELEHTVTYQSDGGPVFFQ